MAEFYQTYKNGYLVLAGSDGRIVHTFPAALKWEEGAAVTEAVNTAYMLGRAHERREAHNAREASRARHPSNYEGRA